MIINDEEEFINNLSREEIESFINAIEFSIDFEDKIKYLKEKETYYEE